MKKIVALILALVFCFALAACSGGGGEDSPSPSGSVPPTSSQPSATSSASQAPSPNAPSTSTEPSQSPAEPAVKWPNGDVTIYSGYSVGSPTDINIRTLADWVAKETGVNVYIEINDVAGGASLANTFPSQPPDGQSLILMGINGITNYYSDVWEVNPADASLFKIAAGFIQPLPESGCIALTQGNAPYSTWAELDAYIRANPGQVTVASTPGRVMDIKLKGLFIAAGLTDLVRWVSTTGPDANAALLGGIINIVMLDEATAVGYIQDGCKPIVNSRVDKDYSYYPDGEDKTIIMSVPTLTDVFGADGVNYMVPNRSMFCVPAGTPDEICAQIAAVFDKIDLETSGEWYDRCRAAGGTSKYYTWPGDEIIAEWQRLDSIIKKIVEMG